MILVNKLDGNLAHASRNAKIMLLLILTLNWSEKNYCENEATGLTCNNESASPMAKCILHYSNIPIVCMTGTLPNCVSNDYKKV